MQIIQGRGKSQEPIIDSIHIQELMIQYQKNEMSPNKEKNRNDNTKRKGKAPTYTFPYDIESLVDLKSILEQINEVIFFH